MTVTTVTVQPRDTPILLTAVGTLRAIVSSQLAPQLAGRIVALPFQNGAMVKRGDVLVELDAREEKADVTAMQAAYDDAAWRYNSLAKLLEDGGATEYETSQARRARDAALSDLNDAKATLVKMSVRAPYDGRLSITPLSLGAYLQGGSVIGQIVDNRIIRIDFHVPESDAPRVKVGQQVTIEDRDASHRTQGSVVAVNPQINPSTRTLLVEGHTANPDGRLVPGRFVDVYLQVETKPDAIVIPRSAVEQRGEKELVYVVENGTAKRRDVTLGPTVYDQIVITQGLQADDQVIVSSAGTLHDGIAVKAAQQAAE